MATAAVGPASVELFYSYAHTDEPLCRELRKHLTGLRRSGLIRDWYDRKIQPGEEWGDKIQQAMERAGIILLLISADFLASSYIFDVEVPFALKRHQAGSAKVVPVLLRPVEWRDSPFANLQMLPSEARAVTLWTNQDEAFSDIAARLREMLYAERAPAPVALATVAREQARTQERILDAALASSVVLDEPTDVVTMVRRTESGGLRAILQIDRTYSPTSDDVQSSAFELDFPLSEAGEPQPATLTLDLEASGFEPPRQVKNIRVPAAGDSAVTVFMVTPKRAGKLRVNLQALSGGIEIGSRALVTICVAVEEAQPVLSYSLTSLPLTPPVSVLLQAKLARADHARALPPSIPDPRGHFDGPSAPSGFAWNLPERPTVESRRASMPSGAAVPFKRSRRPVWIGIGSSAAAIALISTAVMWNGLPNQRDGTITLSSRSDNASHERAEKLKQDTFASSPRPDNLDSPLSVLREWKRFDTGTADIESELSRNGNELQVSLNIPGSPLSDIRFNLIRTVGYTVTAGKHSNFPDGLFPTITGDWKPGDHVKFRLVLPKELRGKSEPLYLSFCIGSAKSCVMSRDILVP